MKKLILPILAILLLTTTALAAPQVVTETHTYVLGDNDSKNDARAMCFLEAKRKILEKAGTLVMSHTQAKMGKLTKDEINSYTAAMVKVESAWEKWRFNESGSMVVVLNVRAVLDYDDIQEWLGEIKESPKNNKTKGLVEFQNKRSHERPTRIDFPDGSTLTFSPSTEAEEIQKVCRYYWSIHSKK